MDDGDINEPPKSEVVELQTCPGCRIEFTKKSELWRHFFDCRRKNSIRAIDVRKKQPYIRNGKKYMISEIERVFRRNNRISGEVTAVIVRLYCDEDKTSIKLAFSHDERFWIDENNCIVIVLRLDKHRILSSRVQVDVSE